MHSHSFQDEELKLHRNVGDSSRQDYSEYIVAEMLTRPQPHEAEATTHKAEATTPEAEATTHEAEAKSYLEILIAII